MYRELAQFHCKVDVLDDGFKEDHFVQVNEAYVLRKLTETLAEQCEAIYPNQMVTFEQMYWEQEPWSNFLQWFQ